MGIVSPVSSPSACSQHALPHELNKISLDTLGESDMGGLLADTKTMAGKYHVMQTGVCSPAVMQTGCLA